MSLTALCHGPPHQIRALTVATKARSIDCRAAIRSNKCAVRDQQPLGRCHQCLDPRDSDAANAVQCSDTRVPDPDTDGKCAVTPDHGSATLLKESTTSQKQQRKIDSGLRRRAPLDANADAVGASQDPVWRKQLHAPRTRDPWLRPETD